MINQDFNYFQEALDRGYWFDRVCILAVRDWNSKDKKYKDPFGYSSSEQRTLSTLLLWNDDTRSLSEKSIYKSKNGYYINASKGYSSKNRIYLHNFKTKGGMLFSIDISEIIDQ